MSSFRGQVSSESDTVIVPQSCLLYTASEETANEKSKLLKLKSRRETTETGTTGLPMTGRSHTRDE